MPAVVVSALLVVLAVLAPVAYWPQLAAALGRRRERHRARSGAPLIHDPGRERRAEQRARELLRSVVNEEEWAMYCELGFIQVPGEVSGESPSPYAYLIYPHKPIVGYMVATGGLLNEYCVEFPDRDGSPFGSRLPASDDVLAKWMALRSDERRLIRESNMHLPGRQVDPGHVRRDIRRLAAWRRARQATPAAA
jgi:hypothetical protein